MTAGQRPVLTLTTFDKQSNARQTLVGSKSNRRCHHYVTITLGIRCFGVNNPGIKTYTTSLTDSKNQWMDSGKKAGVTRTLLASIKTTKLRYFWAHHETQLYWKGHHPRNLIRKEAKRKTKDNLVRQHHSVDRHGLRKSTASNGQQKSTEKDDPWCGQPSDRGRLKSKSTQANPGPCFQA